MRKYYECLKCGRTKYRIIRSYGSKSHGKKVCKHCKGMNFKVVRVKERYREAEALK